MENFGESVQNCNTLKREAPQDAVTMQANHAALDVSYEQYIRTAEQAKLEYLTVYKEMVKKLSPDILEPFAKTLIDRDGYAFRKQEAIDSFQKGLLQHLEGSLETSWEENNITHGLASLEMLKSKFKDFEGTDWEVHHKTPEERTLPQRIRFKEARLRFLQKQLQYKDAILKLKYEKCKANRANMQLLSQERIKLREAMNHFSSSIPDEITPQLLAMQREILDATRIRTFNELSLGD